MVLFGMNNLTQRAQAKMLLAKAAQLYWGLSPLPDMARQELGKPFFPGHDRRQFNLSHSGAYALCALDDQSVGVDIQVVKPWRERLPERVCSQKELAWLAAQPDQGLGFAVLWALKECKVKKSGTGLRMDLRTISVPLPDRWDGPVEINGLWFRVFTGEGWAAAACGHCPPPAEIRWISVP